MSRLSFEMFLSNELFLETEKSLNRLLDVTFPIQFNNKMNSFPTQKYDYLFQGQEN